MELETTRFGQLDIAPESVITFTQPIIGFQQYRRFVLLPGPSHYLTWLQSVEAGELAFILMDPKAAMPDYRVDLNSNELPELGVNSVDELEVYTLVVVPKDPAQVRTNLKAPILVNPKQRLAKQTILDRSTYPIQYPLARPHQGDAQPQEVSHARSDA